jgi:hypothetical protein
MSNITDNPFLAQTEVFPENEDQFLIRLTQIYQDIAAKTNYREISTYLYEEFPNGQQYPAVTAAPATGNLQTPRDGYRKIIDVGPFPGAGTFSFPHGIAYPATNTIRFVDIWGTIFDLVAQSYQAVPNDDIHLEVLGANVVITIPGAYTGFLGQIYLDYTKTD